MEMTAEMANLVAGVVAMRPFVPASDLEMSREFYEALGFEAFPLGDYLASMHLGELVICAPVVAREAIMQRKTSESHWAHMTVHGVLHLLGFDHERDADARKMAAREVQILDQLGFLDPYS